MDRSLRRDGLVVVMVGALLGVAVGVTLGLAVEPAGTGPAQAAPQPAHGAAAAGAPSSEPPSSRAPASATQADGGASADNQGSDLADRPGGRHGVTRKQGGNRRTRAEGRGKDKGDKGKDDKGRDDKAKAKGKDEDEGD